MSTGRLDNSHEWIPAIERVRRQSSIQRSMFNVQFNVQRLIKRDVRGSRVIRRTSVDFARDEKNGEAVKNKVQ
jgi:hypothetical protein